MKEYNPKEKIEEWIKKNEQFQFEDFTLVDLMAIGYELGYNDGVKQERKYNDNRVFKRKDMI